jgi:hypothetical protein
MEKKCMGSVEKVLGGRRMCPGAGGGLLLSNQSFLSHSVVADATQCGGLALQFPGGRADRKACPCNQR